MRPSHTALPSLVCLVCLSSFACAPPLGRAAGPSLTIVAYNVKSLFDEVDEGREFPEFSVAKGKWDGARYKQRLANVAAAVLAAAPPGSRPPGPDLLCLEEIENEKVLEALRGGPLSAARYRYAAIAPAEGGPFSVCALSRVPILSSRCHAAFTPAGRAGRDILEMELDAGGGRLVVIACHWKSKSGGEEPTEEARREAAALVRSRVEALLSVDPGAKVVVCGDLNEAPDEYVRRGKRYATALMPVDMATLREATLGEEGPGGAAGRGGRPSRLLVTGEKALAGARHGEVVLYSPWEESGGYSYCFRESRDRIDNFLLSPGLLGAGDLRYERFSAAPADFLVDGEGRPIAWPGSGATGYSDHLPILLVLGGGSR